MSLPDRILFRELEPIEFGDQELYPAVYQKPDEYPAGGEAKQIFYLTERERRLGKKHLNWQDLTRTSFIEKDDGDAVFTGINIGKRMRGSGLSKLVFEHTLDYLDQGGFFVSRTARIRKPLIALMLKRQAWRPVSIRCEAEVLPDIELQVGVPTIRFIANGLSSGQMKSRSAHGSFYHVAPGQLVADRTIDPEHVIALHTPYIPPEINQMTDNAQVIDAQ